MSVRSLFFGVVAAFGTSACGDGGDENGGGTSDDSSPPEDVPHAAADADLDGMSVAEGDCDDLNGGVYTGAAEVCDGIDNNCDGGIDEGLDRTFYADTDGDGFGDADASVTDCKPHDGYVASANDCDDRDAAIHPGAVEVCDDADVDEDCDTLADSDDPDVSDARTFFGDADEDGYGEAGTAGTTSCDQPSGTVTNDYDCNDNNAFVNPSRLEVCDDQLRDEDCDGLVDDDDPESLKVDYWPDSDDDTYGDANVASTYSCFDLTLTGYVLNGEDCDDRAAAVNPVATELCGPDHVDDDCDGDIDEADDDTTTHSWYTDVDADGYGSESAVAVVTCQIIEGSATRNGDCNDTNPNINPTADEVCNPRDIDEDCDDKIDELDPETPPVNYYIDTDGDGYGDSSTLLVTCDVLSGRVLDGGDCDEGDATVNPGQFDDCEDGVDNDCDGGVDNCQIGAVSMKTDADAIITGSSYYTYTGNRIANVGDLNGDGNGDLAIATTNYTGTYYYSGEVSLMFGPIAGTTTIASSGADLVGGSYYQYLGWSMGGGDDVNGDGDADMIVGTQYNENAYLFYGPFTTDVSTSSADATFTTAAYGDYFGSIVDMAEDYDGDGFGDAIAVSPYADRSGGYYNSGMMYIWSGPVSGSLSATGADYRLSGPNAYDQLGYSGSFQRVDIGDMNGDGLSDLAASVVYRNFAVGPSYYYYAGQVYIAYGGSVAPGEYTIAGASDGSIVGESSYQYFGWSIADGADYNGDGYADLVANSYQGGSSYYNSGLTYVIEGPISGMLGTSAYSARFEGATNYEYSGQQGIAAGDFNADGNSDILVSTTNHTEGSCYYCGGAYLAMGGIDGTQLLSETFGVLTGPSNYSYAGNGVAFVDDWDSDGTDEVAVSQTNDYSTYYYSGSVSVFEGYGLTH